MSLYDFLSRTTVTSNLVTLIMLCIKPVPEAYRTMFTGPNVLIMNIMACRVFRNIRFGNFSENTMQSIITTTGKSKNGHRPSPRSTFGVFSASLRDTRGDLLENCGNIAINLRTDVHTERTVTIEVERLEESSKLDDVEHGLGLESTKIVSDRTPSSCIPLSQGNFQGLPGHIKWHPNSIPVSLSWLKSRNTTWVLHKDNHKPPKRCCEAFAG